MPTNLSVLIGHTMVVVDVCVEMCVVFSRLGQLRWSRRDREAGCSCAGSGRTRLYGCYDVLDRGEY